MQLEQLYKQLSQFDPKQDHYAESVVDALLNSAIELQASDVHLQPSASGYEAKFRIDGVLQRVGEIQQGEKTDIAARLKVLASLLTYRTDIPQEGRITNSPYPQEIRVSSFPALHGERVVLRILWQQQALTTLDDLGLPQAISEDLRRLLAESSGMILITGPSGSGKSTTAYASLRHIVQLDQGGRSIVSLEDPIESEVAGVAQSPIRAASGFDFPTALRSLMRQDPEVILVGEIRDPVTAETALQASLTGQLVLSTFHSGHAAEAIRRLADMGIFPYMIQSGLLGVLHQRLVRKLCHCAASTPADRTLGFELPGLKSPAGCEDCQQTGYRGRILLCEWLVPDQIQLSELDIESATAQQIERFAIQQGMPTRWDYSEQLLSSGITSPQEIRRVLGFRKW